MKRYALFFFVFTAAFLKNSMAQKLAFIYDASGNQTERHEHLLGVGLINMNARLYDPRLHRFLSPDNYIQDIYNTQTYNRYAYAMNNPLMFTDQSGEFLHLIIGALIGGIVNWVAHGAHFTWKGLAQFGVGALAGAAGAGIGAGVSSALAGTGFGAGFVGSSSAFSVGSSFFSGVVTGAAGGAAGGFVGGLGNSLVDGNSFGTALGAGLKGGAWGVLGGGIVGGIAGGIDAAIDGRNFWSGEGWGKAHFNYATGEQAPGDQYSNTGDMRQDYKNNIASRDGVSLEEAESRFRTSVSLENVQEQLTTDGLIRSDKGPAWGATRSYHTGGLTDRTMSTIKIAPALKGQDLLLRNMIFKHEFLHSYHIMRNLPDIARYTEKATSMFDVQYKLTWGLPVNKILTSRVGVYPPQFSWKNITKMIPLWIKLKK